MGQILSFSNLMLVVSVSSKNNCYIFNSYSRISDKV